MKRRSGGKGLFGGLMRGIDRGLGFVESGERDDVWALCGSVWQACRRVGHVGKGRSGGVCMGNSLWGVWGFFRGLKKAWKFLEIFWSGGGGGGFENFCF